MGFSVDLFLWKILSRKTCLIFGEECTSVIVWAMFGLCLRGIFIWTQFDALVPLGFIYAFPLLIQFIARYFPMFNKSYPVLPVRIAECLLGKTSPTRIFIVIPAHFLGAVIAIVICRSIFPFLPTRTFMPLAASHQWWIRSLVVEIISNFLYCTLILVLPYLLDVNRLSRLWINIPFLPLALLHPSVTFNPGVAYGYWFVQNCSLMRSVTGLQMERIIGPLIGAVLASVLCNLYFPDDPASWTRKRV